MSHELRPSARDGLSQTSSATVVYTQEQLHALACVVCNLTDSPLKPCGHVYTGEDRTYGWPAVACPAHLDKAFLDLQHWVAGACVICAPGRQPTDALVVEIDHIEQGTLTWAPVYACRSCMEYRLRLDRALADGDPDYLPALRRRGDPLASTGLYEITVRFKDRSRATPTSGVRHPAPPDRQP